MENYISLRKPLKGFVEAVQILDEEHIEDKFLPCEVIGLCFYEGEAITLMIKLSDGEVFSYIPPTVIQIYKTPSFDKENFSLKDLCFINSPSDFVRVNYVEALEGSVSVYMKEKNIWIASEYICTIDFYKDNELLNLVILEDGLLAFVPFHKMKFKDLSLIKKDFKHYKKQRETYKV